MHYDQSATLTSAFNVLSVVVSTLAGTNRTFDPNVLRVHSYIHYTSTGQQDVLGKIFNVAQRLMVGQGPAQALRFPCYTAGCAEPYRLLWCTGR